MLQPPAAEPMDIDDLVNTWRSPLTGWIATRGASLRDAAEIAQDTLAEAWLARARFRGDPNDPRALGGWLRGIAGNLHRVRMRKQSVHAAEPLTPTLVEEATGSQDVATDDDAHSRRTTLLRAIEKLEAKQREVVLMHYLDEIPVRTTAALLGVPETTVEGRLSRARKELRRLLAQRAIEHPSGSVDLGAVTRSAR